MTAVKNHPVSKFKVTWVVICVRFLEVLTVFRPNPSLRRTKTIRPSSASVRFLEILTGPPSLRRTERVRPSSASVLFGRYFIGPWSASVLEADVSEEKLPSRVLHRPASASVPGRPSPSRDPWFEPTDVIEVIKSKFNLRKFSRFNFRETILRTGPSGPLRASGNRSTSAQLG